MLTRLVAVFLLAAAGTALAQDAPVAGVGPAGPAGPVKKLDGTYKFTEGPAPDADGNVYFSDIPNKTIHKIDAAGKVTRLIDDLPNPNGVRLSPVEKTLYVFPSGQKQMMAYPVTAPGKLDKGRVFCELEQAKAGGNGGGDGGTVDSKGNVYITSATGLQVFDPAGKALGTIKFPEQPSNATFGGKDLKTLYVTARTSVYSCPMEVTGHRYPAK